MLQICYPLSQLRYGQEEIEAMLRSKGAKETVEVERKVSKENNKVKFATKNAITTTTST